MEAHLVQNFVDVVETRGIGEAKSRNGAH
jgi:hypothetical protein